MANDIPATTSCSCPEDIQDPFPAELCLNILGATASILGVILALQDRFRNSQKEIDKGPLRELWQSTMLLHNSLDDLIILVSQSSTDLGTRPFRFRGGGIGLSPRQLLQYAQIDTNIVSIERRIKDLAGHLRATAFQAEELPSKEQMFQLSQPLDDFLAEISAMTYSEFLDRLRVVLSRLEHDLLSVSR